MLDYQSLNVKLESLSRLRSGKPVASSNRSDSEEETEWFEVYPFMDDVFVKIRIKTDSYGDNESIVGLQFVKPVVKSVTDYEKV